MELLSKLRNMVSVYVPYKVNLRACRQNKRTKMYSDKNPQHEPDMHRELKPPAHAHTNISLDLAGLLALAPLSAVAKRTAFTGTSTLLDALIVCPGLHKQQEALTLNAGEYPICAAMTTGYVFRVENQATVTYLQKVGRTGQLTCLSARNYTSGQSSWRKRLRALYDFQGGQYIPIVAYSAAVALTVGVLLVLLSIRDWWGLAVIGILTLARLINIVIVRQRAVMGWKGVPEPGQKSDLIILLSQDKWIRLRGAVDDVKAITSGAWLRDPTFVESSLIGFATLLVYLDAALAGNASQEGNVLLLILLFCSVALLGLANEYTDNLTMYGRLVEVDGTREKYVRRLDLAKQLVKETGRTDWALRLGMLQPGDVEALELAGTTEQGAPAKHTRSRSRKENVSVANGEVQVVL